MLKYNHKSIESNKGSDTIKRTVIVYTGQIVPHLITTLIIIIIIII